MAKQGTSTIRLQVLGPVRVGRDNGRSNGSLITQPRRLAVLTYLTLARPRGLQSRDTLVALLWPESDQTQGRHALRNALHAIRQAVGDNAIVVAGDGLVGVSESEVSCDALALEDDLAAGRVERALERYEGEFLHGFHVSGAPEFEHWVDAERRRLADSVLAAASLHAQALLARGDVEAALKAARYAVSAAPEDERSLRRLVECLDATGDPVGAVRAFKEFAQRMRTEFGADPSPETVLLVKGIRSRNRARNAAGDITSVAILPFMDRTSQADHVDLCQALDTGIIQRLARGGYFSVCAPGVVARFRTVVVDPVTAGRELEVDAVVTGSVSAVSTGSLTVSIEIVRVSDGSLLHSEQFRTSPNQLFDLERAVAGAIGRRIGGEHAAEESAAGAAPAPDGQAYVLYVRGTYLFLRAGPGGHPDELNQSRVFFEQALERDPNFAPAYAGLANYYAVAAIRNVLRPFDEHFGHAIVLSHRALALDPTLAIPHVHFGVKAMYLDSDWELAGREFSTAAALDPFYAESHRFLAIYFAAMGKIPDAIEELRKAVRLEPQVAMFRNSIGATHMLGGEYEEAIIELRHALELDPNYPAPRERLIRCYERVGRYREAIAIRALDPAKGNSDVFEKAYSGSGPDGYRRARAQELQTTIRDLESRLCAGPPENASDLMNLPQLRIAVAYAELGDHDRARAWEDQACEANPARRKWFSSHPDLRR